MKLEEIQLAKKHAYIKENYEKWNFLEDFSASDDYKTEPIDFYFEFKKSSTCSLAELVKKEHRYICNDGYIKEHSIDDLSECIVVHNRKQALKIFANINRIFDDYLSKAGLEGIEYYRQYFEYAYSSDKPVLRKVSIVLAVYPLLATLLYGTSLSLTGPHHCPILRVAIK